MHVANFSIEARRFSQLLAIASQVDDTFLNKNLGENKFGFPCCVLLAIDPGVDLPVTPKHNRAGKVCIALPLVIDGAVLLSCLKVAKLETLVQE